MNISDNQSKRHWHCVTSCLFANAGVTGYVTVHTVDNIDV